MRGDGTDCCCPARPHSPASSLPRPTARSSPSSGSPGTIAEAPPSYSPGSSKPLIQWLPSQNGLFFAPPHRHSEKWSCDVVLGNSVSTSSIAPETWKGPFLSATMLGG